MSRTEKWALGGAAIGHALLFVGLSLVWKGEQPKELKMSPPIDVSLVDEVALESTAPADTEAPADSVAPDQGAPEDAAPPEETAPEPEPEPAPAPPVPQPKPEPRPEPKPAPKPQPAPKPVPKPQPPKPKPAPKPAPKAPEKPAPKPAPKPAAKPAAKPAPAKPAAAAAKPKPAAAAKGSGTDEKAKAAKPRGSRLGDDFAKSLAQTAAEKGTGQTARAAKVGAQSLAGLAAAISRQVQPCANRITNPGPGANRIKSRINLQMAKDGSLTARPKLMGQTGVDDENGRYAQRVGELAAAAIIQCAPFELPDELYEGGWKNITINYKLPG
ncbi:cell envelope biogenesis protein TolA [Sphingomonas sp. PL-96]|uniref:cell envelope biogenesis protein TolA n=1 Tax=Sphingomonas sp. PL-96 TaxID=2887201 RepID=UPI001E52467F|nr:cell envelope biogenesis protein TolA [Sphingomonas sp. PL-96]MCC2976993.1 cell envelope biogenesis protein TolA [Sphingomonas sp. PL-96]